MGTRVKHANLCTQMGEYTTSFIQVGQKYEIKNVSVQIHQ